ncbi:MAG: NAD-dependent epimerase/dehydratase family protein [Candidatus Roizmanbacteria bacterium]|nr:NAD-dependent epimerase/dehydratase family protein [Candidatus Roizmanbacteria bacterium]
MKTALIGYTGFVGSNLSSQFTFTDRYNSKNINSIEGKSYDLIVSAGTSSLKWKANQEGDKDWRGILSLINPLKSVKARQFVLISTVDIYPNPQKVDEDTPVSESDISQPYGKNRFRLEEFVREQFKKATIIRCPQLFGPGLKKNFIYDLIHHNALDFTHKDSLFQWYNVAHMWQDIQIAVKNNVSLINFATEPTRAQEVAEKCAGMAFSTITKNPPLNYNFYTTYADLFGSHGNYLYRKKQIFREIKEVIDHERSL